MTAKANWDTALGAKVTVLLSLIFLSHFSYAGQSAQDEPFNAGKLVMHHIKDAHSWHLWAHTYLPLPVILIDDGLQVFSSGKFDEVHQDSVTYSKYGNYILYHEKIYNSDASGGLALDDQGHPLNSKPLDISITKNVVSLFLSIAILLWLFLSVAKSYKRRKGKAPKGLQSGIEPIIMFVRDEIAKVAIGEKKYERYLPFLLTVFFFIWLNNILGLIPFFPGGANLTGNIVVPMVLAVFTLFITSFSGNKHYWGHVFWMPGVPVLMKLLIVTPLEIIGVFLKPFILMLRLFANIMAGHIVLLVFFCLIFIAGESSAIAGYSTGVPILAFTIFLNCLELLVGFIQAFVFTFLSAVYIGMAVAEDH